MPARSAGVAGMPCRAAGPSAHQGYVTVCEQCMGREATYPVPALIRPGRQSGGGPTITESQPGARRVCGVDRRTGPAVAAPVTGCPCSSAKQH